MILSHIENNYLYLVFQDFEDKIDLIHKEINKFPNKTPKLIKNVLDTNFFNNSLERQKNYISSIVTYIDDITDNKEQFYFHLFILPKDIVIKFEDTLTIEEKIKKIESLSIKLFKLYSQLDTNNKELELFKNINGDNFLQLEAKFYIDKLEVIYGHLLNYKASYKNKIICSDKIIGVEIDELNRLEQNPLKRYQYIKSSYQKDLIKFIYSTVDFIKKYRLDIFQINCENEYKLLIVIVNKINNLLLKVSTSKNLQKEKITKDTLNKFLKLYKNKPEIKENKKLFKIMQSIFFTQLESNVQLFTSIDLTKAFETIVEKKLSHYNDRLYIGNEDKRYIESYSDSIKRKDDYLSSINHLINSCEDCKTVKQYPDFLIEDIYREQKIYHIIDAKYKLQKNIFGSHDIRQILVYSMLFNKEFSNTISNQQYIKKVIIFAKESEIDMNNIDSLKLNIDELDIFIEYDNIIECKDNLFDSRVVFIAINIIDNSL